MSQIQAKKRKMSLALLKNIDWWCNKKSRRGHACTTEGDGDDDDPDYDYAPAASLEEGDGDDDDDDDYDCAPAA